MNNNKDLYRYIRKQYDVMRIWSDRRVRGRRVKAAAYYEPSLNNRHTRERILRNVRSFMKRNRIQGVVDWRGGRYWSLTIHQMC